MHDFHVENIFPGRSSTCIFRYALFSGENTFFVEKRINREASTNLPNHVFLLREMRVGVWETLNALLSTATYGFPPVCTQLSARLVGYCRKATQASGVKTCKT